MSDVSELLISLTKNEQMSESLVFWVNRSFAHFLTKNEQLARKSNERIPSPGAETAILDYEYGISYRLIRMDGSVDYALLV